ncbi:hypothetical protein PSHT_00992 [Puccinia striiformis]|uniref:Uncharacterized protein n=1 Tax=Puccinia striiformis TaxID=27350 RepID=A0A2S4WLV3_9BASI|nr:hypothetical protein PSHT_00992 [Puccinia striiformis]
MNDDGHVFSHPSTSHPITQTQNALFFSHCLGHFGGTILNSSPLSVEAHCFEAREVAGNSKPSRVSRMAAEAVLHCGKKHKSDDGDDYGSDKDDGYGKGY